MPLFFYSYTHSTWRVTLSLLITINQYKPAFPVFCEEQLRNELVLHFSVAQKHLNLLDVKYNKHSVQHLGLRLDHCKQLRQNLVTSLHLFI